MKEIVDWTNANQGFIMALLTLVYVVATIWLAWLARRQLRLATDLERGRTRPFVIFDLVVERHTVFATVINSGETAARDIRISVEPKVQCLLGGKNTYPAEERAVDIAFISRGIAMLAPKREIRGLMGYWPRVKSAHPKLRFEGTISYRDINGFSYSEPFIADLSAHEGLLYRGSKDIEDVAEKLEAISRTLDHIATGFQRPLVRTITEAEYQAQKDASMEEAQRLLAQQNSGEAKEDSASP